MGAFRDFFEGLFDPIKEAIEKVTIGIDEAILSPLKDKLDEFLEPVWSIRDKIGELPAAIEKITGLPEDVGNALKSIATWLDEQKDTVIGFFKGGLNYVEARQYQFWMLWMQRAGTIAALDKIAGWASLWKPDDPSLKGVYDLRKEELEAQGMKTSADLGLNMFAKGLATGIAAVVKAAYSNLSPIVASFNSAIGTYKNTYKIAMETPGEFVPPALPDELNVEKQLEAIAASGEFGLNAVIGFSLGHFLSPVLSTSTAPLWEAMGQQSWRGMPVRLLPPEKAVTLMHRYPHGSADWKAKLMAAGVSGDLINHIEKSDWKGELQKAGYSEDVINDLMLAYKYYPGPSELVSWLAREVYEEDAITKYGLLDEAEKIDRNAFYRAGLDDEQIDNFWKAHWMHPSFTQLTEMLHRGILHPTDREPTDWSSKDAVRTWEKTMEDELYEWYRLVEIPPHWRDKLTAMSYNVPTRVDVRRWYDLRTITEDRLRELYHNMGYHGKDLEDYVLWTKIYVLSSDLRSRYSKGYITKAKVTEELKAAGMEETRANEWTEKIAKATGDDRVKKEKDYTKTEIYKGYKKGKLIRADALEYIERLGYDSDEAVFLLDVNVGVLEGSPETHWELEKLISEFERTQGMKRKDVPAVLIELEKEYREHPEDTELELEYRQAMKDYYEKK